MMNGNSGSTTYDNNRPSTDSLSLRGFMKRANSTHIQFLFVPDNEYANASKQCCSTAYSGINKKQNSKGVVM